MRVVADTNVVVSALLWSGLPSHLVTAAEAHRITLYTSPALTEELRGILTRPRFVARLRHLHTTAEQVLAGYLKLAHLVLPSPLPQVVIQEDPTDDIVLACALAAQAHYVITGDWHVLRLKIYQNVQIVSPRTFLSAALR